MKRLFLLPFALFVLSFSSFAQTSNAAADKGKKKVATTTQVPGTNAKITPATTEQKATASTGPVKKDGTKDMRYRANKDTSKTSIVMHRKKAAATKRKEDKKHS